MCGIAGAVGNPPLDVDVLTRMAETMAHRGPDDQHVWADETCGLAFRRLAVIDLDPRSTQPLHLEPLHLAFNGEIYNYRELREDLRALGHRFHTEGDGEVLLHAWREWDESALDRINGMFAIAVWDERRQRLTLVSDPFGEKPLYYRERAGRLIFGSDIRAILCAERGPTSANDPVIARFLAFGTMPEPHESFFSGIRRLPAAHVLQWEAGKATVRRYWRPQRVEVPARYEDAVAVLREILTDSIRLRLRSDVPVGTSLSGGIDSSAIVALSADLAGDHRRHAFTASFPDYDHDEWAYADAVGNAAGVVEHHRVEPTVDGLFADLEALVRDQEEPFGSTAIYAQWCVFRAAREAGVTVLLDGQGADELFGGYPGLVEDALRSRAIVGLARGVAGGGPERRALRRTLERTRAGRTILRILGRRDGSPYVHRGLSDIPNTPPAAAWTDRSDGRLRRELLVEAFVSSLPPLLRFADRDSMAHSREVRLPFLDRRIAEFALSLPVAFLYRDGMTKRILRDAVRGAVPDMVLDRRDKLAFQPPQSSWLDTSRWRTRIGEELLSGAAAESGLLDRDAIAGEARTGHWRDPNAIWRALSVELWMRAFLTPRRT
jgi:asparagine synthase (glutamine-hydrolysing)